MDYSWTTFYALGAGYDPRMSRERYGSGSMSERSPGVWRLRAYASGHRQVSRTFRGSKRDAAAELARLVARHRSERTVPITFGELLDRWLDHLDGVRTPSTLAGYRRKIEHAIRPMLGTVPLASLTPRLLDACYARWRGDGLAPATVRQYHAIISAACSQAVRWDLLDRSPADSRRVTVPSPTRRTSASPPSPERLVRLLREAEGKDPTLAAAMALGALTGCRRGELCALRWSDVDLDQSILTVARSVTVVAGRRHEGDTKTHQVRKVALDEVALAVVQQRMAWQRSLAQDVGVRLVSNPYLLSYRSDGARPPSGDTWSHGVRALSDGGIRFHDLRHFAATQMIAANVDIRTVAGRLGHATPSTTLAIYAHMLPERDKAAATILGRTLAQNAEIPLTRR